MTENTAPERILAVVGYIERDPETGEALEVAGEFTKNGGQYGKEVPYIRADLHPVVKPLVDIVERRLEHLLPDDIEPYFSDAALAASCDPFNGNEPVECGSCGAWMVLVRPGKHECGYCQNDPNTVAWLEMRQVLSTLTLDPAKKRDALEDENERMRKAIRPFADAVYNDNGDLTVEFVTDSDAYLSAHFALRAALNPAEGEA